MSATKERFSLKDHLFNSEKVQKITSEIALVYPEFASQAFQKEVLAKFPELELLERIYWIRDVLKKHLPSGYRLPSALQKSQWYSSTKNIQNCQEAVSWEQNDYPYKKTSSAHHDHPQTLPGETYSRITSQWHVVWETRIYVDWLVRP